MAQSHVKFLHVRITAQSSPESGLNFLDNYMATIYKFKLVKNE